MKSTVHHFADGLKAEENGFAKYNGGPHTAIELPEGIHTITVKTGDGKLVTFGFYARPGGVPGHQCVDVVNHSMPKTSGGAPVQQLSVRGQGPLLASFSSHDYPPATCTIISIP